jgi:peptidoglycan/LPS O-acetylase OafA/YrhL
VAWRVPEYLMSSSIDVLATIAQVQNFRVFDCMNHSVPPSCGAFVLYWSLSLEEQFYLLLPFVLWFLPRRVVPMLLIAVVLSQIFIERAFAGMLWLIRTDAICIGVLIALFSATKVYAALTPALLRHRPLAWGLLAVCCGIIASVDAPNAHFVRASVGMVAALSGILVWSASYDSGFAIPDGLLRRFLIYFGGRSYGLYVVHYSANWLISKLAEVTGLDDPTGYFRLLAIPTAILFAELNYRFVETPLRKYGAGVATRLAYRLSFPKIGAVQSIDMASGDDMGRADRFDRKYAGG